MNIGDEDMTLRLDRLFLFPLLIKIMIDHKIIKWRKVAHN